METCTKSFTLALKDGDEGGTVEAVIATLETVDNEMDYTAKGAFGRQERVVISNWNHDFDSRPPVGMGEVYEDGNEAKFRGRIFDTDAGREWRETMKGLGPEQAWSYTYQVQDEDSEPAEDGRRRTLKSLKVLEASPVIVPAGKGTRTESIKSADTPEARKPVNDYTQKELREIERNVLKIKREALLCLIPEL